MKQGLRRLFCGKEVVQPLPAISADKIVYIAATGPLIFRQGLEVFFALVITCGDTYILMTFFIVDPYQGTKITFHIFHLVG